MSQLPLPLSLYQADRYALSPALAMLPARMDTPQARVMVHAIGLQESRYAHRRQIRGPARGLYQFEQGGALPGLLRLSSTGDLARKVCARRHVDATPAAIYGRLERDDVLAAAFARLLLWSDPRPLPALGDAQGAWGLYLRTWRPGKPHRHTWDDLYQQAMEIIECKANRP